MKAIVIAIGDELTSGQRLDTNSQWISQQLGDLGIPVLHTTEYTDLLIKEGRLRPRKSVPMRVTYHDPCHLGRRGEIYKSGWTGDDKLERPVRFKQTGSLGIFEPPRDIIRSVPADAQDSILCLAYGQYAVHAGMAGKTNMVIGYWNQHFTHIPIALATLRRKKVDSAGYLWQTVLGTTDTKEGIPTTVRSRAMIDPKFGSC